MLIPPENIKKQQSMKGSLLKKGVKSQARKKRFQSKWKRVDVFTP